MHKAWVIISVGLLALLLGACGGRGSGSEEGAASGVRLQQRLDVASDEIGLAYTVYYPEGWFGESSPFGALVANTQAALTAINDSTPLSENDLGVIVLPGAALLGEVASIDAAMDTAREFAASGGEATTGTPETITLNGKEARRATIESPDGNGFVYVIAVEGEYFVALAFANTAGRDTVDAIVGSVDVVSEGAPVAAAEPTAAPAAANNNAQQTTSDEALEFGASASAGSTSLSSGFLPDPFTVNVSVSGSVDAGSLNLPSNDVCTGLVETRPTFSLNWSGASSMRIFVVASSDSTLVIPDPSGRYLCNDDYSGTLDSLVEINNTTSGEYDIWVGAFGGGSLSATLYITENSSLNPTNPGS